MPKAWSPVMRWPSREWALKISQYFPMSASEMGLLAMARGGGGGCVELQLWRAWRGGFPEAREVGGS